MIGSLTQKFSRRILQPQVLRLITTRGHDVVMRSFGVASKAPSPDPLHLLQQECISRQLCDSSGNRLPGVDWRFAIGVSDAERPGAVRRSVDRLLPSSAEPCRCFVVSIFGKLIDY